MIICLKDLYSLIPVVPSIRRYITFFIRMMVADVFLIKSSHNVRYLAFLFGGLELLLYLCIRNMQRYMVAKKRIL